MFGLLTQVDSNTIMIAIIAFVNAFTAVVTYRTGKAVKSQDTNIHKIEIATNSMKDALVKVTGEAEFAKGLKKGREDAGSL